jgi:hypothetical protein
MEGVRSSARYSPFLIGRSAIQRRAPPASSPALPPRPIRRRPEPDVVVVAVQAHEIAQFRRRSMHIVSGDKASLPGRVRWQTGP